MATPTYVTADDLEVGAPPDDPWPWMQDAACRGADVSTWFPGRGESTSEAVEVCGRCPVRDRCLEYALTERIDHGVYGGLAPAARRDL